MCQLQIRIMRHNSVLEGLILVYCMRHECETLPYILRQSGEEWES